MRQCRLNFAEHRYDCEAGVIGEHNATELIITPPAIMPAEAVYRLCFEPGGLSEIILQTTDGVFSYPLPASVTSETYCCVTLIGYVGSEQIYKSRMVQLHFCRSAEGDTSIESQKPGIVDEINANTSARHTHTNKSVLDRLSDKDGKLQFDGNAIGGGSGGASTAEEVSYTNADLPDVSNVKGALDTIAETQQAHEDDINTLGDNFTELNKEAHTHDNKAVLDGITAEKTAAWDGKSDFSGSYNDLTDKPTIPTVPTALKNPYALTVNVDGAETSYDGSAAKTVAVKGATKQVTSGTAITLADNTEYRLDDVTTLTLTYPTGNFECWMSLTFAASGTITVTLPTGTTYLGFVPVFKNGETWELSIKDGVVVAQGVVGGSAAQIEIVDDGTEVSY